MTSNERLAYAVADYIWGFVTTCMMVLLVYLMGRFAICCRQKRRGGITKGMFLT